VQRSEHRQRFEEEVELLKRKEVEDELRITQKGVLNIQPLTIRSSSHSSSSLKCVEGMAYNEKIQFVQTIIHNCDIIGTSVIEFLRKSRQYWHARE
jgi:hypothetical protein